MLVYDIDICIDKSEECQNILAGLLLRRNFTRNPYRGYSLNNSDNRLDSKELLNRVKEKDQYHGRVCRFLPLLVQVVWDSSIM